MSTSRERIAELRIDREQRDRSRTPRKALLVISLVIVVVAGAVFWWFAKESVPAVTLAEVAEASSSASSRETVLDASGYVVARLQATVSSKITGKIVEIRVEEGLEVVEGQILARLDDSMASRQVALGEAQIAAARSALVEAEVRLDEAEIDLRRTQELVRAGVTTEADLDTAEAEVEALKARVARNREDIKVTERQLELRRQELADTVIRAPFSGVVITKNAQPGEMISPVSAGGGFTRTGICTLVDMSSLEIEVDVNESYINRVKPGQKVIATLDAYQGWKIPASVITTVPAADRQKATVRVRIAFDELDPRLLPDMGAKVSFLGESVEAENEEEAVPTVLVPATAVRSDGGRDIVFVYGGGAVERRAVTLGPERGKLVGVIAGLRGGERVVVQGPDDLADGDEVKVP